MEKIVSASVFLLLLSWNILSGKSMSKYIRLIPKRYDIAVLKCTSMSIFGPPLLYSPGRVIFAAEQIVVTKMIKNFTVSSFLLLNSNKRRKLDEWAIRVTLVWHWSQKQIIHSVATLTILSKLEKLNKAWLTFSQSQFATMVTHVTTTLTAWGKENLVMTVFLGVLEKKATFFLNTANQLLSVLLGGFNSIWEDNLKMLPMQRCVCYLSFVGTGSRWSISFENASWLILLR